MKPLSADTTIDVQRIQFELMRKVPASRRLALAFALTQTARELLISDIRRSHPFAQEEEIRRRFIARVLPREDVIRAYGFDPRNEDY